MRLFNLSTMVTLQVQEALIPIQPRQLGLFQFGMVLQLEHRVALRKLRDVAAMREVDDGGSVQGRRVVARELLDVVSDLLLGEVGLQLGDLLGGVVVGIVGLFAG